VALFHSIPLRVMWADTDPAGIVWFGVFFRYFENAEEELFRRLGTDRTALLGKLGIFMPRTSLQSRFRSPAKLGDGSPSVSVLRSPTADRIRVRHHRTRHRPIHLRCLVRVACSCHDFHAAGVSD
jgi:acyl-CoA thioester hydrolase